MSEDEIKFKPADVANFKEEGFKAEAREIMPEVCLGKQLRFPSH